MRIRALTIAAAAMVGIVLTVSACSTSKSDEASADSGTGTVTIDHRFGSTTLDAVPERIVALSSTWLDAMLDLGVQPVAYAAAGTYGDARGLYPWEQDASAEAVNLGAAVDMTTGMPPIEQVAAQNPDLVLAPYLPAQANYDAIDGVAPTIGAVTAAQVDPWEEQVRTLGKVLHLESKAESVIADADAHVDAVAATYPGLKGKTETLAQYIFSTSQFVAVVDPQDGASRTFGRLGMTVPPQLAAQASQGRVMLSAERVGDLSSDLLMILPNGGTPEQMRAVPGFSELPSVRSGALAIGDWTSIVALNTPSARSVAYALNWLTPQFELIGK